MTSLSADMYNVALLILLIVVCIWLLSIAYRIYSLHSLSAAYSRHELLHVEGITRYSNLTRDHLLSILRARSSHTAHLAQRYTIAAHIDTQRGCSVRREGGDDGGGEVGLHMRLSCTRVSRLDVFVGVPQLAVAHLFQPQAHDTAAAKDTLKSRFRLSKAEAARPSIGVNQASPVRLPPRSLASPSPPPSRIPASPSPFANSPPSSHRSISTMPGPVSISTLARLQVKEAGGWRTAAAGGRGMVASASNSFLPVLEQNEEKKEADVSGKDSEKSDKRVAEDSNRASPQLTFAGDTPVKPAARVLALTAESEVDEEPLVKGWSARDLTVLMRNKSSVDDDVHALHDDEYMYRLPPMVMRPCMDEDISVTVAREWLVRLHQRLEGMNGEGASELYPIILQLRPVDTEALPEKLAASTPVGKRSQPLFADRVEEKEKASDWEDTATKKKQTIESAQTRQDDVLVTELTVLELQVVKREAATSPVSPRSPRVLLSLPSRPSSPSASSVPFSSSQSVSSAQSTSPVSSFDDYLRHIQVCRQLIVPPSNAVYCLEELYGADASSSPDCLVCLTEPKDVLLLPCRHVSICHTCHKSVTRCPVCRSSIQSYMRWLDEDQVWRELGVPGSTDGAVGAVWKNNPHPGLLPDMPAVALKANSEEEAVQMAAMSPTSGRTVDVESGDRRVEQQTEERKAALDDTPSSAASAVPFPVLVSEERSGGSVGRMRAGLALADVELAQFNDGTHAAPNSPTYARH